MIIIFSIMQGSHTDHGHPLVSLSIEEEGSNVRFEYGNPKTEIRLQRKH